nr:kinesin-like protein KIN-12C isoform X2 [Ipomoea trifida]
MKSPHHAADVLSTLHVRCFPSPSSAAPWSVVVPPHSHAISAGRSSQVATSLSVAGQIEDPRKRRIPPLSHIEAPHLPVDAEDRGDCRHSLCVRTAATSFLSKVGETVRDPDKPVTIDNDEERDDDSDEIQVVSEKGQCMKSLEEAQQTVFQMEEKLLSLKGATIAFAEAQQQEIKCEPTVMCERLDKRASFRFSQTKVGDAAKGGKKK